MIGIRSIVPHFTLRYPLNKGHVGIRSTVPCRETVFILEVRYTGFVGHIGTMYHLLPPSLKIYGEKVEE